jgi:hypothetical protein
MCLARPGIADMRFAATTIWSAGSTASTAAHTGAMAGDRVDTGTVRLHVGAHQVAWRREHRVSHTDRPQLLPVPALDPGSTDVSWEAAVFARLAPPAEPRCNLHNRCRLLPHRLIAAAAGR